MTWETRFKKTFFEKKINTQAKNGLKAVAKPKSTMNLFKIAGKLQQNGGDRRFWPSMELKKITIQ